MAKIKNTTEETIAPANTANEGGLEAARQAFLNKGPVLEQEIIEEPVQEQQKEQSVEVPVERQSSPTEFTEIEKEAIKQGWLPEEDFWGDKSKWKPAEEWVKNTDHYERQSQKKRLETIERQQQELLEMMRSERAEKNNNILNDLREKRREAIRNNDIQAEEQLDQKISQLQGQTANYSQPERTNVPVNNQSNIAPEALNFAERNKSWFNQNTPDNTAMMAYAISADADLGTKYPDMPLPQRFSMVESMVNKRFNTSQPRNVLQAEPRRSSVNVKRDYVPTFADVKEPAVKELVDHYISKSEFTAKYAKGKYKPMTRDEYTKKLFKEGTIDKNGNLI